MKPVSVRFKCFGPYMDEQVIDFGLLEKNGLFLICGETGSGKTTILDAMCCALYGRASGSLRGSFEVMRCKLAGKDDETLVEFIFDEGGQRYKFVRSLRMARKNLNDSHNCMVLRDGVYVPLLENPKERAVTREAERIIGLTYDQFRQVIILPQGQFETLLVSNSEEKEKILVSLFHAEQWQNVAEEIKRRVTEEDNALKQESAAMAAKLREYAVTDVAGLGEKRAADEAGLETLRAVAEAEDKALAVLKQQRDGAVELGRAFGELDKREKALAALELQRGKFAAVEQRLEQAGRAEAVGPQYEAYKTAVGVLADAAARQQAAEQKLARARQALEQAQARRQQHEARRPAIEQQKRQLTLLESSRELYRSLGEKQQEAAQAQALLEQADTARQQAEQTFDRADRLWQQGLRDQSTAMEEYALAQRQYLQGIGGVLAAGLTEGEPCPVCGSVHHPAPAKAGEAHVTDSQLEALNRKVQQAAQQVTALHKGRADAQQHRDEARELCLARQQQAAQTQAEYHSALQRKIQGIDDGQALEGAIRQHSRDMEAFARDEERTVLALTEARADCKAAEELLTGAKEAAEAAELELERRQAVWREALNRAGLGDEAEYLSVVMEPEQRQARQTELIRYRTELEAARTAAAEQRELLQGLDKPDVAGLNAACAAGEREQTQRNKQLGAAESALERLVKEQEDLTRRMAEYDLQRQKVDEDLVFARRLVGQNGVSLQRYVLGVMLGAITNAANRLLENVHGGRYRLYRTDETAGSTRKSGLELEVWDARNNERRSVTTLSGGEKFLVALSLAIGLSTVVQAQGGGIRLEAMFIDEGFGSLDSASIHDALEVLQGVQRASGVVGIISHVEQLAETIPTQIHIIKSDRGSRCEVRE